MADQPAVPTLPEAWRAARLAGRRRQVMHFDTIELSRWFLFCPTRKVSDTTRSGRHQADGAHVHNKMGAEASTDDFERPDERAVDRLDGDSLAAILSSLDARSLGMALGVSQHW